MQSDKNVPYIKSSLRYIKTNQSINSPEEEEINSNKDKIIMIDDLNKDDIEPKSCNLEIIENEFKEIEVSANEKKNEQMIQKSRKKYLIFFFLGVLVVGLIAAAIFFFGNKKNLNPNQTHNNLILNFEKLVSDKNPEEPILIRKFQTEQSYTYHKRSENVIYNSTNPDIKNISFIDAYITFYIIEKNNLNYTKVFFSLKNITQTDENNKNSTILANDSYEIFKNITKNSTILSALQKIPNIEFNIGYYTLCQNGTIIDLYLHEKFSKKYVEYVKALNQEFSPILSSKIYQNKGKRMLFNHVENSTDSGHFDGSSSDNSISLTKITDTEDYNSKGIGKTAEIATNQTSNFDSNGTLLNSSQTSKIEFILSQPKNEDEKDYKTNLTNTNNGTKEREEIFNKTVESKEIPKYNLTDKNFIEPNASLKNSSNSQNQTLDNINNNTSIQNSKVNDTDQNSINDNKNQTALLGDGNSTNNNSIITNNSTLDDLEGEKENSTTLIASQTDSKTFSNSTTNNMKRNLQEKDKLISESSNSFKLVSLIHSDSFYKNLSEIFLNFEYDENDESTDLEMISNSTTDSETNTHDNNSNDPFLNQTQMIDTQKKESGNETNKSTQSSGKKNETINDYSDSSKNSTIIKLKNSFISYDEFKYKNFGNKTLSENELANLPDVKNLRLLISSSLIQEREFRMNILNTEILGMNIAIYAIGKFKPMEDKIEFGFHFFAFGYSWTILKTSLEFKVSSAIKDLLMYNENLLQQIISLSNFPFEKIIQETTSIKQSIDEKLNIKNLQLFVEKKILEIFPNLRSLVAEFEEELRKNLVINYSEIYKEFEEILLPNIIEKYNSLKNETYSKIQSECLLKLNQTKLFVDQAQILLSKIPSLPKTIVDNVKGFKENFKIDLKNKLKEIYVSQNIYKINKKWDDWLMNFTENNLEIKFSLENNYNLNISFINHLNLLSNIQSQIKNSINYVFLEKQKIIDNILNSDLDKIYQNIIESENMTNIFISINNTFNDLIPSLEKKIGSSYNETSFSYLEFKSFIEKNMSLTSSFNINIEIENLINIENLNILRNVQSKIKNIVLLFNEKAIKLGTDVNSLISDSLNNISSFINKNNQELSSLFNQIKDNISIVEKDISSFVDIYTKKFNSDIFTTSLQNSNFYLNSKDVFNGIIDAIKNFENYHEKVKNDFLKTELTNEIDLKISNFRSFLNEGAQLSSETIKVIYNSIKDIFNNQGISLLCEIMNNRIIFDVKSKFGDLTMDLVKLSIVNFREKFNFSFDKIFKLRNYFTDIIKVAKNKIPNLIKINDLNFKKSLYNLSEGPSFKKPIPVLFMLLWLRADFRINMNLNIFANANLGGIEIGFEMSASSYLSASSYIDIYVVRAGVTAKANLVEMENNTSLNYKFLDLAGQFKSCGPIKVLNVDIGIWISYLQIRFRWRCWRVWFFRICIPWIEFYFSNPHYLLRYVSPWLFDRGICFWNYLF